MLTRKNILLWVGVGAIALALWYFAARTRLHLVDPLAFIGWIAGAAAGLTALLWWGLAGKDDEKSSGSD
jgi:hypothetical protein